MAFEGGEMHDEFQAYKSEVFLDKSLSQSIDLEANELSQILSKFSLDEICPDMSTMYSRFMYFYNMTNPKYYLLSNAEIESAVATVAKYHCPNKAKDEEFFISQHEREAIILSAEIMSSSTNDVGAIV